MMRIVMRKSIYAAAHFAGGCQVENCVYFHCEIGVAGSGIGKHLRAKLIYISVMADGACLNIMYIEMPFCYHLQSEL